MPFSRDCSEIITVWWRRGYFEERGYPDLVKIQRGYPFLATVQ